MTTKLIQKLFNNFLGLGSNMKKNCLLIVLVLHCINGFSQTDKKDLRDETQICEKIEIDYINKNETNSNFQEYLSEKGFEKVEGFAPSDYYIFRKREENQFYVPFTYGEERVIAGQKVVFCYIFTEIGNEMINRYASISFFDENGNRFEYEKENKEMDLGKTTITWQGKVGHKGSTQFENPILHLWE